MCGATRRSTAFRSFRSTTSATRASAASRARRRRSTRTIRVRAGGKVRSLNVASTFRPKVSNYQPPTTNLFFDFLVPSHQLRLREDVPFDGVLDRRAILEGLPRQRNVDRVDAGEVERGIDAAALRIAGVLRRNLLALLERGRAELERGCCLRHEQSSYYECDPETRMSFHGSPRSPLQRSMDEQPRIVRPTANRVNVATLGVPNARR